MVCWLYFVDWLFVIEFDTGDVCCLVFIVLEDYCRFCLLEALGFVVYFGLFGYLRLLSWFRYCLRILVLFVIGCFVLVGLDDCYSGGCLGGCFLFGLLLLNLVSLLVTLFCGFDLNVVMLSDVLVVLCIRLFACLWVLCCGCFRLD